MPSLQEELVRVKKDLDQLAGKSVTYDDILELRGNELAERIYFSKTSLTSWARNIATSLHQIRYSLDALTRERGYITDRAPTWVIGYHDIQFFLVIEPWIFPLRGTNLHMKARTWRGQTAISCLSSIPNPVVTLSELPHEELREQKIMDLVSQDQISFSQLKITRHAAERFQQRAERQSIRSVLAKSHSIREAPSWSKDLTHSADCFLLYQNSILFPLRWVPEFDRFLVLTSLHRSWQEWTDERLRGLGSRELSQQIFFPHQVLERYRNQDLSWASEKDFSPLLDRLRNQIREHGRINEKAPHWMLKDNKHQFANQDPKEGLWLYISNALVLNLELTANTRYNNKQPYPLVCTEIHIRPWNINIEKLQGKELADHIVLRDYCIKRYEDQANIEKLDQLSERRRQERLTGDLRKILRQGELEWEKQDSKEKNKPIIKDNSFKIILEPCFDDPEGWNRPFQAIDCYRQEEQADNQ